MEGALEEEGGSRAEVENPRVVIGFVLTRKSLSVLY